MTDVTRVTGGSVMFEDATKIDVGGDPQYWPTRRARVELTFVIAPDETDAEGYLSKVQANARARTAEMLGQRTPNAPGAAAPTEASATTRKRRTQAEIAADNAAAAGQKPSGDAGVEQTSGDPAAIDMETEGLTGNSLGKSDPAALDEWESPPAEVTDADLNSAVQKKNAVLNDPPKIRALIGSYNPDQTKVFQLREIPQAQRAGFLEKLEGLK